MPSYLDLAVLGIVLVSALLSMMRGFTREVLAIASSIAAAAAAYYFYPRVMPYLTPYIHKDIIAQAAAAAIVFFVTLIIVSCSRCGCPMRSSTAGLAPSTGRWASCSGSRGGFCLLSSLSPSSTGWSRRSSSPNGSRTPGPGPSSLKPPFESSPCCPRTPPRPSTGGSSRAPTRRRRSWRRQTTPSVRGQKTGTISR